MLGQLHKKPSIPRLMSVSTIPSAASETDCTQNDVPVKVTTDHTYSSPTPKPMQESSLEVKPASDHTYAEYSDTPTEPYGSDTEYALDSVSTGVTKEGWLIVASTNRLEISVEYLSSTTLLEATGMSQNASEMLLDASNAGIVRASPDKSERSPLPDETADHEALLEATTAPEPQDGSLSDETQRLLPDESNQTDKMLPDATDATDHSNVQLPDKTSNMLSDGMRPDSTGLPDKTAGTKNQTSSSSESPDTMEDLSLKGTDQSEHDNSITEKNKMLINNTNQGSVSLEKPDNTTTELTNSLVEHDKTKSATTLSVSKLDVTVQPSQNEETMRINTTPSPLPLPEVEPSKEQTDATETTTEQVIGEISYMECSNDLHSVKSSSEVPINFKPVETSSVVSELPEFSHTPDTTLTNNSNSSSGSSLPQGTSVPDKNNNDTSNLDTTESSGSSRTKWKRLKTCIIRLTELINQEREQWMSGSSQTTSTASSTSSAIDGSSTGANDSRYNMRARQRTSVTRSTGRKRAEVNYAEQGNQDSGCDSDYEAKLKPQQPLDNKPYPSASRIATQHVIETNRASKQTIIITEYTFITSSNRTSTRVCPNK